MSRNLIPVEQVTGGGWLFRLAIMIILAGWIAHKFGVLPSVVEGVFVWL